MKHASIRVSMQKIFGDARTENPIIIDEEGAVYAQNNPSKIRGHITQGPRVYGPGSRR